MSKIGGGTRSPLFYARKHPRTPGGRTRPRLGLRAVLAAVLAAALASCAGVPAVRTFFIDAGVQQYYVDPVGFKGGGLSVAVDLTFRGSSPDAICNFTLKPGNPVDPAALGLSFRTASGDLIPVRDAAVLFRKRASDEIRFTSLIAARDFRKIVESDSTSLILDLAGRTATLEAPPAFYRAMRALRLELDE